MTQNIDDSELYAIAENEVDNNLQDDTLWRKAIALMGDNEEKIKKKYIKLRILQLKREGYQHKKNTTDHPENKKTESKKENIQENKNEREREKENDQETNKKTDQEIEIDDIQQYDENKNKKRILGIIFWIALVVINIWVLNVFTKKEQSNSTTLDIENMTIEEEIQTVDDYISDPGFIQNIEKVERETRELKEKEARKEKEAADIEYLEAIQEMGDE